jgi:SAM-dependent methyltransferase
MDIGEIATNVALGGDGIWHSKLQSPISYPDSGNDRCFELEGESFWFNHRNRCIVELLKRFPPSGLFFDIGGGNGCVSRAIQDAEWRVALLEPGSNGAKNARLRGIDLVISSTFEDAGFLDGTIEAAGLFDVLEHVPDDLSFLQMLTRSLKKNGRLYLTVPAYDCLWSREDEEAGHYRRYTRTKLISVLERAGLRVEYATYFFAFLPLPILLRRSLPHKLGPRRSEESVVQRIRAEHTSPRGPSSFIVRTLLNREVIKIGAGRGISLGSSCLAAASRI